MEDKDIFKSFLETNVPLFNVSSSSENEAPRKRRVRTVRGPVRSKPNQSTARIAPMNESNEEVDRTSVLPSNGK